MIAQECKELRAQLEEVANADEREKIVEQLESRRDDLVKLRDSVVAVGDSLKAMSSRMALAGKLDPTKCLERVRKIREALKEDPLSITKGRDFSNMQKAFEKFSTEGIASVETTWEQYLPLVRPTVDTNQLAQAEQQKSYETTALKLRRRAKHAGKISKKPPANEEEFSEIESAWDDIRQMMSELPDVADDPKVQDFLKAANSRDGASIELLTDEVREWLSDNNITDKYCVRTK